MSSRPPISGSTSRPRPIEVAIVGNDALVAALPARPVQLSHAIHAMGYDYVIPVSWGEELLAEHALRALSARTFMPAIFCACSRLRERLLIAGSELAAHLITFVPPAVAAARYVRALHPSTPVRITYIGGCDTGGDPSVDATIAAADFMRQLAERGISALRQPAVFDSVIPPDRRRHYSLPGGCPAPNAIATRTPEWHHVTVDDESFAATLADLLIAGGRMLIDLAPKLGCSCCSAFGNVADEESDERAQGRLAEIEPPRSPWPVLDHDIELSVEAAPVRRGRGRAGDSIARGQPEAEARTSTPDTSTPVTSALLAATPAASSDRLYEPNAGMQAVSSHPSRDEGGAGDGEAGDDFPQAMAVLADSVPHAAPDDTVRPPSGRESLTSEGEITRTALPADATVPRTSPAVHPNEVAHDSAARRRIAVTPASVPVIAQRSAAIAVSPATGIPTVRSPLPPPSDASEEGGVIASSNALVEARDVEATTESRLTLPLIVERSPAANEDAHDIAALREGEIDEGENRGAGAREVSTDAPPDERVVGATHALGRARRARVHETFFMARLAAHARAARSASGRTPQSVTALADAATVERVEKQSDAEFEAASEPRAAPQVVASAGGDANAEQASATPFQETGVADVGDAEAVVSDPATIVDDDVRDTPLDNAAAAPLPIARPANDSGAAEEALAGEGPLSPSTAPEEPSPGAVPDASLDEPPTTPSAAASIPGAFAAPIESGAFGARASRQRGRVVHPPLLTSSERRADKSKDPAPTEPNPMVTLAISIVAIVAVLVAIALVLQRNPLAP